MQKEKGKKSFTQISEGSFTCSMSGAEQTLKEYEEGEAERKRACCAATGEPCSRVAPSSSFPSSTSISCSNEERVIGPLLHRLYVHFSRSRLYRGPFSLITGDLMQSATFISGSDSALVFVARIMHRIAVQDGGDTRNTRVL